MLSSLTVIPYNTKKSQNINIGEHKPFNNYSNELSFNARLVTPISERNPIRPPKGDGPFVVLKWIKKSLAEKIHVNAYREGLSDSEYIEKYLKIGLKPNVAAVESKSAKVGNLKISTHIDGEQYFTKAEAMVKSATKSIQLEMFEFQNLSVDGKYWGQNGAEKNSGASKQQKLLWQLIKKKQANPEMKVQVILDAHKWYTNGKGERVKHYGNQDMIRFLKQKGIDVVPYPRSSQQGANLQHVKLIAVDGNKVLLGGMNWGTHSAANHDACVALETLPGKKSSEVDNIIEEHFNTDWKFAWQRLGETELVPGPLNEAEQIYYRGLNKEIKPENVDYHMLLKEFYDTPEAKNRYVEEKLGLIETHPVEEKAIKVLGTKPRELEKIEKEGIETTRDYLMDKIKACKKVKGELFFFTDKELVKTVIQRHKAGELDAQFVINKVTFPYCENAYDELMEAGVPVRIYKTDKETNQRMHAKWAVFDDKEVVIGSTNWSAQGLNQNLEKGFRNDYPLNTEEINKRIIDSINRVKPHEDKLKLPSLNWNGDAASYEELKSNFATLRQVYNQLKKKGDATFEFGDKKYFFKEGDKSVTVNGKKYPFEKGDKKSIMAELRTIRGYYGIIQRRHLSKEHYKRGNNELAIAFESPSLAKNVFTKQFGRDWKFSESKYDNIKFKQIPDIAPKEFNTVG